MAQELSIKAELLSQKNNIDPQVILEIDGIDLIFGAIKVTKLWQIGDAGVTIGQSGLLIGGSVEHPKQRDFINIDEGTTRNISQQIRIDQGGTTSISKMNINLVDKSGELTDIFQPDDTFLDILSPDATVYLNFEGGNHPQDSIVIFNGTIEETSFGAGNVTLSIAHPESLKRSELFQLVTTNLDGAINDSVTTISLDSTTGIIEPSDILESYVLINDELVQFTGISGNDLTGCTRGALSTTNVAHANNDEVTTFYRINGSVIPTALKLMLSGGDTYYIEDKAITDINFILDGSEVENSLYFGGEQVQQKINFTVGDLVTITGASEGANNVTDKEIISVFEINNGSYIVLEDGTGLVQELTTSAVVKVKSKYNTLNEGVGLKPHQVDIEEHEELNTLFGTSFPGFDFYVKDTINAKELLDQHLLFPNALFNLPRKGRVSLSMTLPPIASRGSKRITSENVTNPEKLKIMRSTNQLFYNAIVYRYDEIELDEKFRAGLIVQSTDSTNRIKVGNKPLTIDAKGIRKTAENDILLGLNANRLIKRYRYAAEKISVGVKYSTGFNVDIGDTVIFGDENLQISDISRGDRRFAPRVMEVTNKKLNIISGQVELELTTTNIGTDGRFGIFSPSSIVGSGSTVSQIVVTKSYNTGEFEKEKDKWQDYIGEKILVHDEDWTYSEEVTLVGFDLVNPNKMNVSPNLSSPPSASNIVDIAKYPSSTDKKVNELYKAVFCFSNAVVAITSGTDNFTFFVGAGDISKFSVGSIIKVFTEDYSAASPETTITNVDGGTFEVTVADDLGFTPTLSHFAGYLNFVDDGLTYRYI